MGRQPRENVAKEQRKQRMKYGDPRLRMSVDPKTMEEFKKKGLVPHWVNDVKSRVNDLQLRGYTFVNDPTKEIEAGEDSGNSDIGSAVSKVVGTNKDGTPQRAYLMVQQKEFYEEDQMEKEKINLQVDEAIRRGSPNGPQQTSENDGRGNKTYVKNVEYQP